MELKSKTVKTTHLKLLTDNFGTWQHFEENKILKSEGYALDDSSRALIVFLLFNELDYAEICFRYIERSFKEGSFIGFFWEDKSIRVFPSSEDALALSVWALAVCINMNFEVIRATTLLNKINLNILIESKYIRTQAYTLISLTLLNRKKEAEKIVAKIINDFNDSWQWFEDKMTYANAIIPYSLIIYLKKFKIESDYFKKIIKNSINTLNRYMYIGKIPSPIGNRIWYKINKIGRDIYGQQPVEAGFNVILMCEAYTFFKDKTYIEKAQEWVDWFYGNNIMKETMITKEDACSDGIDEVGIAKKYGAESTIIYLWALKVFNLTIKNTLIQ